MLSFLEAPYDGGATLFETLRLGTACCTVTVSARDLPDGASTLQRHDVHSYVDVAPLLAAAGYRVIVPYLPGYGTTRFLSSETFRNG
jgi:hypothetical protein